MRKLVLLLILLIVLAFVWQSAGLKLNTSFLTQNSKTPVKVFQEENTVVDAVKRVGPSVVTVGEVVNRSSDNNSSDPFSMFFNIPPQQPDSENTKKYYLENMAMRVIN